MELKLIELLLANVGLQAVVGDRVHWLRKPASVAVRPYLNLQIVDAPVDYHTQGETNLYRTQVQCDLWGETYMDAKAARDALVAAVSGYVGTLGDVNFRGIFVTGGNDRNDETTGSETQLFRKSVDIVISWKKEI